ncbi:MAG TPA: GNAT family N-acetyltransferase [Bacteroidia bacterium]|nr:GNAT family N-acetyltransferase [Bacteroidia bacterium]HNP98653.1 GNAT family N-acetyltransferase [Bacteroidia bacterium]
MSQDNLPEQGGMLKLDILQTKRLTLQPLSLNDRKFIFELTNTPGWKRFIGDRKIHNEEDAAAYIQRILDNPNAEYWTVSSKKDSRSVGVVTVIKRDYLDHHDIGFAFLPDEEKKGYAYEASSAAAAYLLHKFSFSDIQATTVPENEKSIALLKKLGLDFIREIEVENEVLHVYGASRDQIQLSLLTNEFYSVFRTKNGEKADVEKLTRLCVNEVSIRHKTKDHSVYFSLTEFIRTRKEILERGDLTEFEEHEIRAHTQVLSNIAQRHSQYQKSGVRSANAFRTKGDKLFQFVRTDDGWKISSVLWEDE